MAKTKPAMTEGELVTKLLEAIGDFIENDGEEFNPHRTDSQYIIQGYKNLIARDILALEVLGRVTKIRKDELQIHQRELKEEQWAG